MKERKAIYFETEGKNKGCWVMPASAFKEQTGEDTDDSKVIVRSNNTVTYVGKDIAYQLWKFGLLGKDFYYLPWPEQDVYITTARAAAAAGSNSAVANRSTTSSTRASPICRTSWSPACARSATTSRPIGPFISPTKWSR